MIDNKTVKREGAWMIVLVVLGMLAFWSFVSEGTEFGALYSDVFILVFALFSLAVIVPKYFDFRNLAMKPKEAPMQVLVGLALGLVMVGSVIFDGFTFSLLSPISAPVLSFGVLGWESLAPVFLMSIVVSELEESLYNSALRPSIMEWLTSHLGVSIVFLLLGLLVWVMFIDLRMFGLIAMGLGVINFFSGKNGFLTKAFSSHMLRAAVAILMAALFFSLLHLRNFSGLDAATGAAVLHAAFVFAIVAGSINTVFRSSVSSKVAHTVNNGTLTCLVVGIPPVFGLVIGGIHGLMLYILSVGDARG